MVIFRENTEDIYAGIEYAGGSPEAQKVLDFLAKEFPKEFSEDPLRHAGESRRVAEAARAIGAPKRDVGGAGRHRHQAGQLPRHRAAGAQRHRLRDQVQAQERHARPQGQHHEVHRRRLPRLGLRGRRRTSSARSRSDGGPWCRIPDGKPGGRPRHQGRHRRHHAPAGAHAAGGLRRHRHAEPQRRLPVATRWPRRSAASASRPAATSTTSPATPSSKPRTAPRRSTPTRTRSTPARVVLRGEMMLRYMGWTEAADLIIKGLNGAIRQQDASPTISPA